MSSSRTRSLSLLFVLFALAGLALGMRGTKPAVAAAPAPVFGEVLEVHDGSLTTYQLAGTATPANALQPRVTQRAVSMDGAQRAAGAWPMAVGGSPFGSNWGGTRVLNGVDLVTGSYSPTERDISLPTEGILVAVGRSYNGQQWNGSSRVDSAGLQGNNWAQSGFPEVMLFGDNGSKTANDLVYLHIGADRFVEFKRVGASSDEFQGKQGTAGFVAYTAVAGGDPDFYVYTDRMGMVWTFFGHHANSGYGAGQLWKVSDADSNFVTYVSDTTASTAASSGYDTSGGPLEVFDPSGRRFTYTYSAGILTQVLAETKTGGTWASPTGLETVAQVDYEHYTASPGTHGTTNDLETVVSSTPLSDTTHTSKQYYRYWRDADAEGDDHLVKLVLSAEGVRQYDLLDSTFNDSHESASDAALADYASHYFEYDGSGRIILATFGGNCGCAGGTIGTYEFTYETNTGYTDGGGYTQTWATRTIVERPDATFLTQYFDEVGQAISQVVTDGDPSTGTPDTWATKVVRDSYGIVTAVHTPANVTAYTHTLASVAFTTSTSLGLIENFELETSGGLRGFLLHQRFQEGTNGENIFLESYTYVGEEVSGSDGEAVRPMIASIRQYPVAIDDLQDQEYSASTVTSYSYAYYESTLPPYASTLALETSTVTNPAVDTSKNGSGSSTTSARHFDQEGREDFAKSEDGAITYTEYTGGRVTKRIEDADTTKSGVGEDFNGISIPTGFSSAGSPIHHVMEYAYPESGVVTTTLPTGRVSSTYVSQTAARLLVRLSYPKVISGTTPTWYGPVGYTVSNLEGKPVASGSIAITGGSTTMAQSSHVNETHADIITAVENLGLGNLCRLTTTVYDKSGGTPLESWLYFNIPGSGAGNDGENYDATTFAYDGMGRRIRMVEPSGTISRVTLDAMGRVTNRWVGTNDHDFAGGNDSGPDNMVATEALEYDGGSDGGNGFLSERTLYVEGSSTDERVTSYEHDVRGNVLLVTSPTAPHAFHSYDNLGRRVATSMHSATTNIVVGTDDPTTETSNRLALSRTFFDEMGRVWKTTVHKIDAADGSDDDNLESLTWYDAEGKVIKVEGETLAKIRYDELGRTTHHFVLAVDNDTAYADADDVSGDIVLEEDQTVYDPSTGLVLMQVRIDRLHDDKDTGETTGELDTNADADDLLLTAANIAGRPQITGLWYDSLDRVADTVLFGTYGGSNFDRDGLSVPARSNTALRTTNTFGTDGGVLTVEDPKSFVSRTERDDAGRVIKSIKNYDADVNSGNPSVPADNVTVLYEYTNGLQTKITADLPSGSTDQETVYTFGTTKGASAGDSRISTGHLLQKIQYPDSSGGSDVVTFAYNAQNQQIWKKDQSGNILEWSFDDTGRETHERVTTLDGDFDGAVRRISTAYDDLGRHATVLQYDNSAPGSGTAQDGVAISYDGWGNITEYEEDRNSAVSSGNDEYSIGYSWATGELGRNTLRKDVTTLPSGAELTYDYFSVAGRHDDDVSRVTAITHGATRVVSYLYIGVGEVVETDYLESDVRSRIRGASTGSYPGWDEFNRVIKNTWTAYGGTETEFIDLDITYDRNSNITFIKDNVHSGFDVAYTIDDVDRLTEAQEGSWGGSSFSPSTRNQKWTLDHVGNWELNQLDLNGDNNYSDTGELDESRTHNDVNEMTNRDPDSNPLNGSFNHTYDGAGNLTGNGSRTFTYDAFGRLKKVKKVGSGDLVAEHRYNGLGHRIGELVDTNDDGDVDGSDDWWYYAHDERWRVVAKYVGTANPDDPAEEYVHHAAGMSGHGGSSYIDLVVLRDVDTDADGDLDDGRLYYCQNWRADVSALVDDAGEMYEWVKYSAYGVPIGLPGADTDSDGDCDSTDIAQIVTWKTSGYDVRGDVDLDGDVDDDDESIAQNRLEGLAFGRDVLSGVESWLGYAGYAWSQNVSLFHVRHRALSSKLGRWMQRDRLVYLDGMNMYEALASSPIFWRDPSGLGVIDINDQGETVGGYHPQDPDGTKWGTAAGPPREPVFIFSDDSVLHYIPPFYVSNAHGAAKQATGNSDPDDPATNAMRHCYGACIAAKKLGEDAARKLGYAKELVDQARNSPRDMPAHGPQESLRDLAANERGFKCAREGKDCFACCYDQLCSNCSDGGGKTSALAVPK